MTNEGTQVDPDELDKLASALQKNADTIRSAAHLASGIDYNVNTFGLFGALMTDTARETARKTVIGLGTLAENVTADGFVVTDTAVDFRNNEDTQVDRFRGEKPHG
jgi:hypothetical protein